MRTDMTESSVALKTDAALQSWNKMILGFLSHAAVTPVHLGDMLEREPDFALGHAVKGLFCFMLGRKEMEATAHEALAEAKRLSGAVPNNSRETHFIAALDLWINGKAFAARDRVELILKDAPRDTLAMKISHAISFILGDATTMRASIENVLPAYKEAHAATGYVLGCHAFALEETGDYKQAEVAGRKGMLQAPDDAWGLHAVAHVYDMTANAKAGLDWLENREEAWAHCNNFRYHVWWHKALMLLDQGDIQQVLELYDTEIRRDKTDDYRDISNATSLLSRLELEGVSVGTRWDELADISEKRTEDGCLIFADLHYMLALVGGDRQSSIKSIMQRLDKDAHEKRSDAQKVMSTPGVAAMTGLEAFGESDFSTAFVNLSSARSSMQSAGGSHAQRDVFERLTIDAGIRGGFFTEAEAILNERKTKRGGTEDAYAASRFELISNGLGGNSTAMQLPAE